MISTKSLNKIAAALAPEVVEYIYNDERWTDFIIQIKWDNLIAICTVVCVMPFQKTLVFLVGTLAELSTDGCKCPFFVL
jgi:hypothetical protein